ncbi:group IIE secretory phospholipase A2-like [Paroedura picta]|uniref:group IIE secretory phospholipase A2-like n=1 Tax=Paroedura picta TaxID=143630 RepID=UPI0040567630
MSHSLRISLLLLCALSLGNGNLIQFGNMVRQATGKLASLYYNGYGCYCGLGGSKQPLDETDWCCRVHDCCYEKMSSLGCDPKLETYSYYFSKGNIFCNGKTMCHMMICQCDKDAALCFRRAAKTYQLKNVYYPNIFCRGETPSC